MSDDQRNLETALDERNYLIGAMRAIQRATLNGDVCPDVAWFGPGDKRRTIRRVRKTGNPEPGKPLQLFTGMRTKECEKIRDVTCTRVRSVVITCIGVQLEGRTLFAGHSPAYLGGPDPDHYDGDFAHADGFDTFSDMVDFFDAQYGLPFRSQLIEWSLSISPADQGGE